MKKKLFVAALLLCVLVGRSTNLTSIFRTSSDERIFESIACISTPMFPADNAVGTTLAPLLSSKPLTLLWTINPAATSYDVYFSPNQKSVINSDESIKINVATNALKLGYLLSGNKQYFWKVVPKNEGGSASDCPVWNFKTESLPCNTPVIDKPLDPDGYQLCAGTEFEFAVTAHCNNGVLYKWKKNGIQVVDGKNISGASTSTLHFNSLNASDSNTNWSVEVSCDCGGFPNASSSTSLIVDQAPVIRSVTATPPSHSAPGGTSILHADITGDFTGGITWFPKTNMSPTTGAEVSVSDISSTSTWVVQAMSSGGCSSLDSVKVSLAGNSVNQTKITSSTIGMMEARHIGPAVMGGRIACIDAINSNPRIMYVGAASGGVWKTLTGGTYFKPIFDKYTQSIGALTIDQNHPDTVWVGTGESNMRNSVSIGTGLYRSTDAGENWTKVGLDSTEHISRIVIDPRNSNVVYVAVPGALWGDSKHRGLYKTTDGGATWEKILYTDEKTGCAEIIMNPKNPDVLYASMWQFRRTPYSFSSGGKTSALYKSTDAGKTWKKIVKGLPEGEFGRIAINISPSEPQKLFAIVESKNTGLYLSDDGGETWRQQSSTSNVNARPFYFSVIQVDPKDSKRIYRPAFSFSISDDGGQSFTEASQQSGWIHSDMHALWINPNNTSQMYLGTDGGVYMSLDRGNNWIFLNNIPVSQFYHVQVDSEIPYNVYGGLQDNGSWTGPSQSINGIENRDWENVGGGDGFWVQPDRTDKNIVYSESQGGEASRFNRKTNESASIKPQPLAGETKLRFNWNSPLYSSPTNPNTLYIGAQYLYRTRNKGITWDRISGDLTTNDSKKQTQEESGGLTVDNSSAENHCTVFTVCESPLDENLIWAGTDDGNLQVTTDGGKTWTKVNQNISVKDMPAQTWVSSIEASRYDKKTVYASFDNHAYGDMKSYVFKSTDLGKTWKALSTSDLKGYAHRIKEDIVSRNLLFLGTELGLWISFDGGESWVNDNAKIPPVAVRDIVIEPRSNDLVLATHGRGILIVDDISPLRKLTPEIINAEAALLPTRPTPLSNGHFGGAFPSAGGYVGNNVTEDAVIIYYLKERVMSGDVKVEIYDASGKRLQSLPGTKRKGLNKLTWNMRMKPPRTAPGVRLDYAGFVSPLVEKGTYTVKLLVSGKTYEGKLELVDDPLLSHSADDMAQQRSTSMKLFGMVEELAFFTSKIVALKDTLGKLDSLTADKALKKNISVVRDSLEAIRKRCVATKGGTAITGEERIREKLSELFANVVSYLGRPNDLQQQRLTGLEKEMAAEKAKAETLWSKNITALNAQLAKANLPAVKWLSKEEYDKTDTRK